MSFIKDVKAQISAEMIIVLAALLAVAIILVTKLSGTSKAAAEKIDTKTTEVLTDINGIESP